ncbi:MAG TPA: sigma-70 family RNA polymerase sigma factor [Planctomycetota bacterium]
MAPTARALEPEELLAQTGWVRGIVRRLVLDEGLAEDVVQDTWVAALERGSAPAGRGGLRAWLAAVAGNLARRRRRREAVRAALERAAARAEGVEPGAGELERLELQRALVEALVALDEPLRSAVVLRHLDGLAPAEIARRQGCTRELARQRVSRGLAQLRTRLAARDRQGLLALVPLLGRMPALGLGTGGLLVSAKVSAGIAGGVIVAAALWLTTGREPGRGRSEPRAAPAAVAELASPAETAAPPAVEPGTSSAEQRTAPERGPEARAAPCRLVGRVTDTRGVGLARATVRILRTGPEALSVEAERALEPLREDPPRCDEHGALALELPGELVGRRLLAEVACDGFLHRQVELEPEEPFTLALQALPAFVGRLLDPAGQPVPPPGYVRFDVLDAASGERRERTVELEPDGSYRATGLPLGRLVHVEARARGFATRVLALDQALEPDRTETLDVALAPGAVVTGTVLDAKSGAPVAGAKVWLETFTLEPGSVHPHATTGADGRFRLTGANEELSQIDARREATFWLLAEAEGYVSTTTRAFLSEARDDHAYDFELTLEPAGCALELRLALADGRPAAGAQVWTIDAQGNPRMEAADEKGVLLLPDLPAGRIGLWIELREGQALLPALLAEAGAEQGLDPLAGWAHLRSSGTLHALRHDVELAPGETRVLDLVLEAAPASAGLRGRVVDVHGQGVPGVVVHWHLNFEGNGVILAGGWEQVVTEADGSYALAGLHPGTYELWLDLDDPERACSFPAQVYARIEGERTVAVEDLVAGRCLTLEGRVEPAGHDPATLAVVARDPRTRREHARVQPAADGGFRFEPLVERDYELVLLDGERELDRANAGPASAAGLFLRAR